MEVDKKKHFVLVHGACHGAWCWYKVIPLLRSKGYRVTALDMAAAGVNNRSLDELKSYTDYCSPLLEFMEALPNDEKVILLGHSLGGITMSLAMERFPQKIAVAVFVTAFMPGPNLDVLAINEKFQEQVGSYMDSKITYANDDPKLPASVLFGPEFLSSKLYQWSPPEDLALATLLMRPVGFHGGQEFKKELALSKEKYGSVRRLYLICENDQVLKQEIRDWMIANNPGAEVKTIYGADHMPMFSKFQELYSFLQEIAEKTDYKS